MKFPAVFATFAFLLVVLSPHAQAKDDWTTLNIVVANEEGDPVPRASLIVRTLKGKKKNKVDKSLQLRTSQQGTAPIPPLKRGFVLIQVIAEDYQTFGDRFELTEPEQTISITLKPPQKQYSVHQK
jgi:hypothetical protein